MGKNPSTSWRQCLLWPPHKGSIITVLHLGHMVFRTQRQYVKESFCCLIFSPTPFGKQWRSREANPLEPRSLRCATLPPLLCFAGSILHSCLWHWCCSTQLGSVPHSCLQHQCCSSWGLLELGLCVGQLALALCCCLSCSLFPWSGVPDSSSLSFSTVS